MAPDRSPPPTRFRLNPQPWKVWMAGGRLDWKSLPEKQLSFPAGPDRRRSARPDPRIRLSRTVFPVAIQRFLSTFGNTPMP